MIVLIATPKHIAGIGWKLMLKFKLFGLFGSFLVNFSKTPSPRPVVSQSS